MIYIRYYLFTILVIFFGCEKAKKDQGSLKNNNDPSIIDQKSHSLSFGYDFSNFEYYDKVNIDIQSLSKEEVDYLLREMYVWDQKYRGGKLHKLKNNNIEHLKKKLDYIKKRKTIDSINFLLLERITKEIGWPDYNKYSTEAVNGAFLTVLHINGKNNFNPQVFEDYIKNAFELNKIGSYHYAILIDHLLIRKKLRQKFGTHCKNIDGKIIFYNIDNVKSINENRKNIGLLPIRNDSCELISY